MDKGIQLLLLELLQEKKHFLEEFYRVNILGLKQFTENNFEDIDAFYLKREGIINILQMIDTKINHQDSQKPQNNLPNSLNHPKRIQNEPITLLKTEILSITQLILQQDLEIIELVKKVKNSIITDIQRIQKNKKMVSSYKTKVTHHQIDEEI